VSKSRTYGFEKCGLRLRDIAYLHVLQPPLDFGADFLTVTMNILVPDQNGRFRMSDKSSTLSELTGWKIEIRYSIEGRKEVWCEEVFPRPAQHRLGYERAFIQMNPPPDALVSAASRIQDPKPSEQNRLVHSPQSCQWSSWRRLEGAAKFPHKSRLGSRPSR
jgi:hypothetical protein